MTTYDVLVVGGGAAGLGAAVTLGRARRSVLVVDAGEPRNGPAEGVHGYLGLDGINPKKLLATGREEVERYGGIVATGEVVAVSGSRDAFVARMASGEEITARRLLITTGLVDELPDIPGLRERWGRDVVHCPYCHGWEVQDEPIGVLASSPRSAHQAMLFRQWSDDVTLFLNETLTLSAEDRAKLDARGIAVMAGKVNRLVVQDDQLAGVQLADGSVVPRTVVTVGPRFVARSALLTSLGVELVEHPMGVGEYVDADPMGQTTVPGVFVAGNVSDLMAQVVTAAAAGVKAAGAINADLLGLLD